MNTVELEEISTALHTLRFLLAVSATAFSDTIDPKYFTYCDKLKKLKDKVDIEIMQRVK